MRPCDNVAPGYGSLRGYDFCRLCQTSSAVSYHGDPADFEDEEKLPPTIHHSLHDSRTNGCVLRELVDHFRKIVELRTSERVGEDECEMMPFVCILLSLEMMCIGCPNRNEVDLGLTAYILNGSTGTVDGMLDFLRVGPVRQ